MSACNLSQAFVCGIGWWVQMYCCVFWSRYHLQDVCDIISPSPVVMSDRHYTCRKIWNLFNSTSLFSLKHVPMKSSMSMGLIRGVPSWIRMLLYYMKLHDCDIHDGFMHFFILWWLFSKSVPPHSISSLWALVASRIWDPVMLFYCQKISGRVCVSTLGFYKWFRC